MLDQEAGRFVSPITQVGPGSAEQFMREIGGLLSTVLGGRASLYYLP